MGGRRAAVDAGLLGRHRRGVRALIPAAVRDDRGSAIVDMVLVSVVLTVLFLGVVQVALILHVRNTLIDAAGEGARYGALAGRDPDDGAERAAVLIERALAPRYAEQVASSVEAVPGTVAGEPGSEIVIVTVRAPLPVIGLVGPRTLDVSGRALREGT